MKILLIAHNASIEGSGIAFAHICRHLAKLGANVIAVVPGTKGVAELISDNHNILIEIVPEIRNEVYPSNKSLQDKLLFIPRLIRQLYFRKIFRKKLEKIILKEKPDIIHSNTGTLRIPSFLAEKYNIPHVWHVRECQSLGYNFKPFGGEERVRELFAKKNNRCIFITKSVAQYNGFTPQKDIIIYDGVFTSETVSNLKNIRPKKKNVILFVGLLSEIKGVPMLLEAFDRISEKIPEYELWLVGKDKINIQKKISKLKSHQKIRYLGFRKDIYKLMAESKLLVVASDFEGFGFITAEAMLNRTLVVGRNIAGTKEQMDNALNLKDKELALRFESPKELSEAIIKGIHLSKDEYENITEEAFDVVSELYTVEKNTNNIINFYNRIISERKIK